LAEVDNTRTPTSPRRKSRTGLRLNVQKVQIVVYCSPVHHLWPTWRGRSVGMTSNGSTIRSTIERMNHFLRGTAVKSQKAARFDRVDHRPNQLGYQVQGWLMNSSYLYGPTFDIKFQRSDFLKREILTKSKKHSQDSSAVLAPPNYRRLSAVLTMNFFRSVSRVNIQLGDELSR
jgi:hypothetical protein